MARTSAPRIGRPTLPRRTLSGSSIDVWVTTGAASVRPYATTSSGRCSSWLSRRPSSSGPGRRRRYRCAGWRGRSGSDRDARAARRTSLARRTGRCSARPAAARSTAPGSKRLGRQDEGRAVGQRGERAHHRAEAVVERHGQAQAIGRRAAGCWRPRRPRSGASRDGSAGRPSARPVVPDVYRIMITSSDWVRAAERVRSDSLTCAARATNCSQPVTDSGTDSTSGSATTWRRPRGPAPRASRSSSAVRGVRCAPANRSAAPQLAMICSSSSSDRLALAVATIDPGVRRAKLDERPLKGVARPDDHALAGRDVQREQRPRHALGLRRQLGVRQALRARYVDECFARSE